MAVVGITTCRKLEDYRQAVLHVGGDVRLLDPSMTVQEALEGVDGLLLTGGGDLSPEFYGEPPHPSLLDVDPERDRFELALVAEARKRDVPILAICRGIQVLNVACGGTLIQDIPSEQTGPLEHNFKVPPNLPFSRAHEIWVEKDSLLAALMKERLNDTDTVDVNSRHHQAVKLAAPGFKVSATAPDGVIEAIEDPAATFCVGVQWHPENFWRTGEFRPLFEGFLNAAQTSQTANRPS
ncbi:MAG: gamma-glutamyl-gamma-aminobutyrate hydrolase family protein [Vicinamibacterales bacterium]